MSNYGAGRVVPQGKTGGWSATGNFLSGDTSSELTLQAVFPVAEAYTVEFNLIQDEPSNLAVRAEALITWSVEGNSVTRRVSVGNGVSVSGTGQGVRVSVKDTTDRTGYPPPFDLGKKYHVSVQVAPGTRAAVQQPPTLNPFPGGVAGTIDVPAAGFLTVPIPKDAGVISVSVQVANLGSGGVPIPDQGVWVSHEQSAAILKVYDPRVCCWVAVAPGADLITLFNNTANTVNFTVTFGIDG